MAWDWLAKQPEDGVNLTVTIIMLAYLTELQCSLTFCSAKCSLAVQALQKAWDWLAEQAEDGANVIATFIMLAYFTELQCFLKFCAAESSLIVQALQKHMVDANLHAYPCCC